MPKKLDRENSAMWIAERLVNLKADHHSETFSYDGMDVHLSREGTDQKTPNPYYSIMHEIIPEACFMFVLQREGERWKALAFEMPNQPEREAPHAFLASIRQIEADTGLDLDPALPQDERRALENAHAQSVWP